MEASNNQARTFEQQWHDALDQAEFAPGANVWESIDATLSGIEAKKYKRGFFYYRLVAAAAIIIALGLAVVLVLQNRLSTSHSNELANHSDDIIENRTESINEPLNDVMAKQSEVGLDNVMSLPSDESSSTSPTKGLVPVVSADATEESSEGIDDVINDRGPLVSNFSMQGRKSEDLLTGEVVVNTDIHMYNVPVSVVGKRINQDHKLWAGLGLSSGNFDPNIQSTNEAALSGFAADDAGGGLDAERAESFNDALAQTEENYDPGITYGLATSLGWRVAPKLILQSGLQYQFSQSTTQTNTVIGESGGERFAATSLGTFSTTESQSDLEIFQQDVELDNNFQFLSIPLKVTYLFIDRRFQLGLNTGLTTDFFIKNSVNTSNNLVNDFEQKPGDDSPYRSSFFSGLVGIDLGYNFLNNYYLVLEPSYRRSLNSFTKSGLPQSNPSGFSLSVGFRYLFK